jgi:hypothetical protein
MNVHDEFGYTPLHYCKTGKAAKLLCGMGADCTITDKDGNTAQKHHAVSCALCYRTCCTVRQQLATSMRV